jgi:hypothetical protein
MITDKQQTKILREARHIERKAIKELNKTGKRLEWVRIKLCLTQLQVCEGTGIPTSSYCGREAGIRADMAEEYLVLSVFFDRLWKGKYKDGCPSYNGDEVKTISVQWLLFGHHNIEENADAIMEEYKVRAKEIEEQLWLQETEARKQLDMFKEQDK